MIRTIVIDDEISVNYFNTPLLENLIDTVQDRLLKKEEIGLLADSKYMFKIVSLSVLTVIVLWWLT